MIKSPFQPGDIVRWGRYGKYYAEGVPKEGLPDFMQVVANEGHCHFSSECITIRTLDGSWQDTGYAWNWFIDIDNQPTRDDFRTAVWRSKHKRKEENL